IAAEQAQRAIADLLQLGAQSVRWAAAATQHPGGKISIKELSELPSKTGREVVTLDDKDVMRALEKNLKGAGVHYAIERETVDGKIQHILHVRGDDAQVVANSLERAARDVDAKRERTQTKNQDRTVDASTPQQDKPTRESKPEEPAKKTPKLETAAAPKRSKAETEQFQKELREKVKARAAKIRAEAPKPAPKIDVPKPTLKR
ncbi:DUF3801 domain-containing protein, partial [Burkholderia multivorans]